MRHLSYIGFVAIALFQSPPTRGNDLNEWLLNELTKEDLTFRGSHFSGHWNGKKSWEGFFCDARLSYSSDMEGMLSDLTLQLSPRRTIDVHAVATDLSGDIAASYQSALTLCLPVRSTVPYEIERIVAKAEVSLGGQENERNIRIRILSTLFDRIHLRGSGIPRWVENSLTYAVNVGFKKVWGSYLGAWISDVLSKRLGGNFPYQVEVVEEGNPRHGQ